MAKLQEELQRVCQYLFWLDGLVESTERRGVGVPRISHNSRSEVDHHHHQLTGSQRSHKDHQPIRPKSGATTDLVISKSAAQRCVSLQVSLVEDSDGPKFCCKGN